MEHNMDAWRLEISHKFSCKILYFNTRREILYLHTCSHVTSSCIYNNYILNLRHAAAPASIRSFSQF